MTSKSKIPSPLVKVRRAFKTGLLTKSFLGSITDNRSHTDFQSVALGPVSRVEDYAGAALIALSVISHWTYNQCVVAYVVTQGHFSRGEEVECEDFSSLVNFQLRTLVLCPADTLKFRDHVVSRTLDSISELRDFTVISTGRSYGLIATLTSGRQTIYVFGTKASELSDRDKEFPSFALVSRQRFQVAADLAKPIAVALKWQDTKDNLTMLFGVEVRTSAYSLKPFRWVTPI